MVTAAWARRSIASFGRPLSSRPKEQRRPGSELLGRSKELGRRLSLASMIRNLAARRRAVKAKTRNRVGDGVFDVGKDLNRVDQVLGAMGDPLDAPRSHRPPGGSGGVAKHPCSSSPGPVAAMFTGSCGS